MVKGKKGKHDKPKPSGRVTRSQRRAMERSLSNVGLEDLDAQLKSLGLCTKNITGDGNCLFRALSDQYFGQDSHHQEFRQQICEFLRNNEENYKYFVEDDQSFEHHVQCMSHDATYGGNMELAAFAKMKEVDIKVYQPGMIYIINGKETYEDNENLQVLHIAYHSWEHYSSVRNIDGPFSGPPEIKITSSESNSLDDAIDEKEDLNQGLNSKEKVILQAYPDTNIRKMRRLLIKYKGDPDKVIDALYEEEEPELEHVDKHETMIATAPVAAEEIHINTMDGHPDDTDILSQAKEEFRETESDHIVPNDADTKGNDSDKKEVLKEEEQETQDTKPKKKSASDRKREQKQRQKEQKLTKEREKAARKLQRKQNEVDTNDDKTVKESGSSQSMKEMYI